MSKLPLTFIIVVVLAVFASADLYLNQIGRPAAVRTTEVEVHAVAPPKAPARLANVKYALDEQVQSFKVVDQVQTLQLFEKIDLSSIGNIKTFRHKLEKGTSTEELGADWLYLYEIQGPPNQGSLTYLNVKLQLIAQVDPLVETLNETGDFGNNSLFLNDQNYENTAFLLTQVGDNLYGFQYSKQNPAVFDDVKGIISSL